MTLGAGIFNELWGSKLKDDCMKKRVGCEAVVFDTVNDGIEPIFRQLEQDVTRLMSLASGKTKVLSVNQFELKRIQLKSADLQRLLEATERIYRLNSAIGRASFYRYGFIFCFVIAVGYLFAQFYSTIPDVALVAWLGVFTVLILIWLIDISRIRGLIEKIQVEYGKL